MAISKNVFDSTYHLQRVDRNSADGLEIMSSLTDDVIGGPGQMITTENDQVHSFSVFVPFIAACLFKARCC